MSVCLPFANISSRTNSRPHRRSLAVMRTQSLTTITPRKRILILGEMKKSMTRKRTRMSITQPRNGAIGVRKMKTKTKTKK